MANVFFEDYQVGSYYVKLESDHKTQMDLSSFVSVSIEESLYSATPTTKISYMDSYGDTFTKSELSFSKDYNITIGKDLENAKEFTFTSPNIRFGNSEEGMFHKVAYTLELFNKSWNNLMFGKRSKAWRNATMSDVVEYILVDSGVEDFDIEDTTERSDVIQPYITNFEQIKWIAENSKAKNRHGGFIYGMTAEGKFIFRTLNSLMGETPKLNLIMGYDDLPEDSQYDAKFEYVDGTFSYSNSDSEFLFGNSYYYFDYKTKTFTNERYGIAETNQNTFTDNIMIDKDHTNYRNMVYGGRNTDIKNVLDNEITTTTNHLNEMTISIEGRTDINIGDIVKLSAMTSTLEGVLNVERVSGKWMISKVLHRLDIKAKDYKCELVLTRSGYNTLQNENLETNRGKVV